MNNEKAIREAIRILDPQTGPKDQRHIDAALGVLLDSSDSIATYKSLLTAAGRGERDPYRPEYADLEISPAATKSMCRLLLMGWELIGADNIEGGGIEFERAGDVARIHRTTGECSLNPV